MVTYILEEINKHFGDLVIIRGGTQDLLGIDIKIRNEKKVELIKKTPNWIHSNPIQGYLLFKGDLAMCT